MMYFILVSTIILIVVYSVHSGVKYTRMITHIFMGLKYQPSSDTLESTTGEKVTILDSGGHEFEVLVLEKKNAKNLLVFCHDSGSSKESWETYASFFPDFGFSVVSVDFSRKDDGSEKNSLTQWPTHEDVNRLLLVLSWTRNFLRADVKIILFGVSKGANIALAASSLDRSVCGVVADGLFSMKEIFRDYIRKWAPILVRPNLFGEKYPSSVVNLFTNLGFWYSQKKCGKVFVNVEKLLRQKHPPLCMIHGETDDYISPTHQKFLHGIDQGATGNRLVIPGAGHNQAVVLNRDAYEKTILDFLKKAMG